MKKTENSGVNCPVEELLKQLAGKWKMQIFSLALHENVRFNSLLREINGASKQSIATALREMEESGLLEKIVVSQKPLHIEYTLTEKSKSLAPVIKQLEPFSGE
ncbi:winged helix-turn-helix transcriptional regulator [Flavobacterium sp. RHBU_3]|uniref:winged helix-turn-helix transcriptional regulator n=1 Tax=Flavobacterium sp. RHBU_3 TaxID=3391184 RepID=UPI00398512BD